MKNLEMKFFFAIFSFGLLICFGMKSGRKHFSFIKKLGYQQPKFGYR